MIYKYEKKNHMMLMIKNVSYVEIELVSHIPMIVY